MRLRWPGSRHPGDASKSRRVGKLINTPANAPHARHRGVVHMLNPIDRYDVFIGHNSILQLAIDIGQS